MFHVFISSQPERIDPPDPTKPDYDIRADVWSLGISLVELLSFYQKRSALALVLKVAAGFKFLFLPIITFHGIK